MGLIKQFAKWLLQPNYRKSFRKERELAYIKALTLPLKEDKVWVDGKSYFIAHPASFVFMYREIFEREIYKFNTPNKECIIIDAGANIGLSVLYFKQLVPACKIIAFEPDPHIKELLLKNMEAHRLSNVEVVPKALWSSNGTICFSPDGSDAGKVSESGETTIIVETVRLSDYLKNPIAMLKLDIEGAEMEVLEECEALLGNVQNMFVEYHSLLGKQQRLAHLISILEKAGFRLHITNPSMASDQALVQRREEFGMDMQLNIYCFRNS